MSYRSIIYSKGMEKGFDPEGERYTTRVDVTLDYSKRRSPMSCTRWIGKTTAYDRFGRIQESGVARV